jgi:hypothetical protein
MPYQLTMPSIGLYECKNIKITCFISIVVLIICSHDNDKSVDKYQVITTCIHNIVVRCSSNV